MMPVCWGWSQNYYCKKIVRMQLIATQKAIATQVEIKLTENKLTRIGSGRGDEAVPGADLR